VFRKQEIISVFDIEGNSVKLAQVAVEDTRRFLCRLTLQRTKGEKPDELIKAVRKLAGDHKVAGTRVIVNLPRHKVTVKNFKLPSVNPIEIENMVTLQATKQLPFSPDKIISGYKILRKDKNGYSDILAVLVQRNTVENLIKIFSKAGLTIERLALGSEAISLWYAKRQREDEKRSSVLLADIGRTTLDIQVVREGILDFTRAVSFASTANIEERMFDEIKKSIFTYKKSSPGYEITKLVLAGRRSVIKREASILKDRLGLPMVYIDAIKTLQKSEFATLPDKRDLELESFTSASSLAFYYDNLETNLIPKEIRLKRISKMAKESLAMSGVLLLSILLGIAGIATKNYIDKKLILTTINEKLKETKPKVENLTKLKGVTGAIKEQLNLTGSSIDIIRELYSKIPPEISLTILDYEDGGSCLVRGTSQKLSDVFKFISTLEDSSYFENVKVRYATKRFVKKKEFTDFEIICKLSELKNSYVEREKPK